MDWQRLCTQLNLGELLNAPIPLTGGLMHKMFRVDTDKGCYAVKWLNPHVMARPEAPGNFAAAEELERKLEQAGLAILPALTIHEQKMHLVDEHYLYVFPYFEGVTLVGRPITPHHCEQVGTLLAGIHGVERRQVAVNRSPITIDWDALLATADTPVRPLLADRLPLLKEMQQRANEALPHLPAEIAICHNDLDPKNVLWQGDTCRAIDLECLGYDSPGLELLETALCWAGYESGRVDTARLTAFLQGYRAVGGILPTDWEPLYDANAGRLEWLAYNLRRAAGAEGDAARTLGITEVEKTLTCLTGYHRMRNELLTILKNVK